MRWTEDRLTTVIADIIRKQPDPLLAADQILKALEHGNLSTYQMVNLLNGEAQACDGYCQGD